MERNSGQQRWESNWGMLSIKRTHRARELIITYPPTPSRKLWYSVTCLKCMKLWLPLYVQQQVMAPVCTSGSLLWVGNFINFFFFPLLYRHLPAMLFIQEGIYNLSDPSGQQLLSTHKQKPLWLCVIPQLVSIKQPLSSQHHKEPMTQEWKNSSLPVSFEESVNPRKKEEFYPKKNLASLF